MIEEAPFFAPMYKCTYIVDASLDTTSHVIMNSRTE
jgi:hypothetical protein